MKIMSLNVNKFQTEYLMTGSWAMAILLIVKEFLKNNPNGAVFLYEVPRGLSPEELRKILSPYDVVPSPLGKYFYTVAVIKNANSVWTDCKHKKGKEDTEDVFIVGYDDKGRENYANRYVELVKELNNKKKLRLLGLHAPNEPRSKEKEDEWEMIGDERIHKPTKSFFDRLKEYAEKNKAEKLIILGDMNVHSKEPCTYFYTFNDIRKDRKDGGLGYSDLVKDGTPTYKNGNTLDHVLVSPELKGKVTARVEEDIILSDHAVIIVDIKEDAL